MKLGFTTLGCLEWDLETILSKAQEYGFDGVDFRGYRDKMNIFELAEFSSDLEKTVSMVKHSGIEVPCLSSSVKVMPPDGSNIEDQISELKSYACLCEAFGATMIRIFGGRFGKNTEEQAIIKATENLHKLAEVVAARNITLMLETHDDWIRTDLLRKLMQNVDSHKIKILWDIHHPYRIEGEKPEISWNNICEWVRYTHLKDSRVEKDSKRGYKLCLPGDGDVPLKKIISLLKAGGYDGYLTFEWERKWHPEIEKADIAFPRYVAVIREILEQV